jgi:hypothetical protein
MRFAENRIVKAQLVQRFAVPKSMIGEKRVGLTRINCSGLDLLCDCWALLEWIAWLWRAGTAGQCGAQCYETQHSQDSWQLPLDETHSGGMRI